MPITKEFTIEQIYRELEIIYTKEIKCDTGVYSCKHFFKDTDGKIYTFEESSVRTYTDSISTTYYGYLGNVSYRKKPIKCVQVSPNREYFFKCINLR